MKVQKMENVVILVIVILTLVQFMVQPGQATVFCGEVETSLAPCITYLTQDVQPYPACCNGVRNLKGMALTVTDQRTVCICLKNAAKRYSNLKEDAAQTLPQKCRIKLDFPISRSFNCELIS
uniref:Non-specific lipid-transfer protein n=2 Tax=Nicotiana TaxID=4085 RepID=A0A1S3X4U6_TOBAC|nr:PREDICTED: non-specific lipid-transfer protein 2-like [Nicotiana sylvestris]XP_016434902.1 PREDICTED: non-specific lipid-transfer protein 2-like [Nicotiana tabacum]